MTRTPIQLTDELNVELVDHMGTELNIVNAARVSFNQESEELSDKDKGLLKFLMRERHSSPFEHCVITFKIEAPITVVREWHRHRSQSYNETSGRYTTLLPKFYVPNVDRPLVQKGKPGAYYFEAADDPAIHMKLMGELRHTYQTAWDTYEYLLDQGVAKEVARLSLPVAIYTSWFATANLRNWLHFLGLRTDSTAMWEIRETAFMVENILFELYPDVLIAWDEFGRGPV